MKVIGIEIKSMEAILVVLEKDEGGIIRQSNESTKIGIIDSANNNQIRQFKQQVKASLDNINADRISILARNGNAKARMAPSPFSFKLEGIFQLYEKVDIEIIWPQTVLAFLKKTPCTLSPGLRYQENAFNLACYLLNQ